MVSAVDDENAVGGGVQDELQPAHDGVEFGIRQGNGEDGLGGVAIGMGREVHTGDAQVGLLDAVFDKRHSRIGIGLGGKVKDGLPMSLKLESGKLVVSVNFSKDALSVRSAEE